MKDGAANPKDFTNDPKRAWFEYQKKQDAFFEQNLITGMADYWMDTWPDWRDRYLDPAHDTAHIEYVFRVIGDNHPCPPLPKIYQYLYICRERDTEITKLEEIAGEAEEYLQNLAEYDRKYAVKSWDPIDFEEKGLGDRFNSAQIDAQEAASVCYREIGHYYARFDDSVRAVNYYRKAVNASHDGDALYALLKHLMDAGEFDEAKRYCTGLMYAYAEFIDPRLERLRALVHYNLKEYGECIEVLSDILEREDDEELKDIIRHVVEEQERCSSKDV